MTKFAVTGFDQNLHAIFCLAENAVSDRSTRPDDVHILYSGRSVEINNTDAEGRLVVSDGVVYAKKDLKVRIQYKINVGVDAYKNNNCLINGFQKSKSICFVIG